MATEMMTSDRFEMSSMFDEGLPALRESSASPSPSSRSAASEARAYEKRMGYSSAQSKEHGTSTTFSPATSFAHNPSTEPAKLARRRSLESLGSAKKKFQKKVKRSNSEMTRDSVSNSEVLTLPTPYLSLTYQTLDLGQGVQCSCILRQEEQSEGVKALIAVREVDSKIIRPHLESGGRHSSDQARRSSIRQACINNLKIPMLAASKEEMYFLKQQDVLGKRAPSGSLLDGMDMVRLLDHFGCTTFAAVLKNTLDALPSYNPSPSSLSDVPIGSQHYPMSSPAPPPKLGSSKKKKRLSSSRRSLHAPVRVYQDATQPLSQTHIFGWSEDSSASSQDEYAEIHAPNRFYRAGSNRQEQPGLVPALPSDAMYEEEYATPNEKTQLHVINPNANNLTQHQPTPVKRSSSRALAACRRSPGLETLVSVVQKQEQEQRLAEQIPVGPRTPLHRGSSSSSPLQSADEAVSDEEEETWGTVVTLEPPTESVELPIVTVTSTSPAVNTAGPSRDMADTAGQQENTRKAAEEEGDEEGNRSGDDSDSIFFRPAPPPLTPSSLHRWTEQRRGKGLQFIPPSATNKRDKQDNSNTDKLKTHIKARKVVHGSSIRLSGSGDRALMQKQRREKERQRRMSLGKEPSLLAAPNKAYNEEATALALLSLKSSPVIRKVQHHSEAQRRQTTPSRFMIPAFRKSPYHSNQKAFRLDSAASPVPQAKKVIQYADAAQPSHVRQATQASPRLSSVAEQQQQSMAVPDIFPSNVVNSPAAAALQAKFAPAAVQELHAALPSYQRKQQQSVVGKEKEDNIRPVEEHAALECEEVWEEAQLGEESDEHEQAPRVSTQTEVKRRKRQIKQGKRALKDIAKSIAMNGGTAGNLPILTAKSPVPRAVSMVESAITQAQTQTQTSAAAQSQSLSLLAAGAPTSAKSNSQPVEEPKTEASVCGGPASKDDHLLLQKSRESSQKRVRKQSPDAEGRLQKRTRSSGPLPKWERELFFDSFFETKASVVAPKQGLSWSVDKPKPVTSQAKEDGIIDKLRNNTGMIDKTEIIDKLRNTTGMMDKTEIEAQLAASSRVRPTGSTLRYVVRYEN